MAYCTRIAYCTSIAYCTCTFFEQELKECQYFTFHIHVYVYTYICMYHSTPIAWIHMKTELKTFHIWKVCFTIQMVVDVYSTAIGKAGQQQLVFVCFGCEGPLLCEAFHYNSSEVSDVFSTAVHMQGKECLLWKGNTVHVHIQWNLDIIYTLENRGSVIFVIFTGLLCRVFTGLLCRVFTGLLAQHCAVLVAFKQASPFHSTPAQSTCTRS